mmetsp:Transcript_14061/g.30539  ORF Transcript_14061/g.30539 Transcript_14061/m.30539 type:complete len:287 (+) Transcript_14061:127-987(+)
MSKRKTAEADTAAVEDTDGDKAAAAFTPAVVEACAKASASSSGGGGAKTSSSSSSSKRLKSDQEKRQERREANRVSARDSRTRKKMVFEELQRSVARLAEENAMLRRENDTLRFQMAGLKRQLGMPDDSVPPTGTGLSPAPAVAMPTLLGTFPAPANGTEASANAAVAAPAAASTGAPSGDQTQAFTYEQQLALLAAAQQQQMQQMMAAGINPALLFGQVAQQTGGGATLPVGPSPVQPAAVAGAPTDNEPKTAVLPQGDAAASQSAAPVGDSSDPKPEEGGAASV